MALVTAPGTLPVLRDYEVLEKIADGSMASVYKARHRESGDVVAVKLPCAAVAKNPVLLQRFQEEFRVGSTLRHPALVRALEFCREETAFYLVMEYVDGPDLWQRVQEGGPLPEAEAIRIIVQVAHGLHEAHRHGIIHRDVKPDNILLAPDGQAKLGDLGLIKDLEGELGLTQAGKGLGTPEYIAPEQFGDARNAGVPCDVYSLGATLYMAVTGKLPFEARSLAASLRKKTNNELVPPRQLVRTLSERVDWAIRRALQANPAQRYASCPEFVQALTGEAVAAAALPVPTARPTAGPGKSAADDRRRGVRYSCTLATVCEVDPCIHDGEAEAQDRWEGIVQDLSTGGVRLLLRRRFEPGTELNVALEAPDHVFKRTLQMRVKWVRRGREGRWSVGGKFSEPMSKEDVRKLL